MSDKFLPPEGLSEGSLMGRSERRAFLRRAVGIGVPVVLATVRGRSVQAQDVIDPNNQTLAGSGCMSFAPSGWLTRDGEENYDQRIQACEDYLNQQDAATDTTEPASEPLLPPEEEKEKGGHGNAYGKGGKKK